MSKSGVSIKIDGLDELENKLSAMGQEMGAKALVSSAYAANKTVVDAIRTEIQSQGLVETGLLIKSISRKKIIYAKDGTVVILTGVNKNVRGVDNKGKIRVPWRYANVLEPKFKFMKNAFETSKQKVVDRFTAVLERKIKRFTNKK